VSTDPQPSPPERALDFEAYAARVLFALGAVALAVVAVYLRAVVVLAFGSVLVAVALRTGASAVRRASPLSERAALAAVVLGVLAALVVGIILLGNPVGEQFDALRRAVPGALQATTRWLNSHEVGLWLLRWWDNANSEVEWTKLAGLFGSTVGALGSAVLMIVMGLYLAADPGLYLRGVLHLLPRRLRARVAHALAQAGHGLARWLVGQAVAMLLVGLMMAIALAAIGMPLALPLGIVTGIVEFVPFFGPIASAALIVLLAFAQGASQALYAALVCIVVQHIEGYVIQPFVQRWAIALPLALGLISVIVFGLLFGPLGVLFAVPLMVVLMILVQELYVDAPRIAAPAAVIAQEPHLPSTPSTGRAAGAAAPDYHARDSE